MSGRMASPGVEDEVLDVNFSLIGRILTKNLIKIACASAITLGILGTCLILYPEKYVSESIVFLNLTEVPNTIKESSLPPILSKAGITYDLFKSQEDILKGKPILEKVYAILQSDNATKSISMESLENSLEGRRIKETEYIKLTVKRKNPKEAYLIAKAYLKAYQEIADDIDLAPLRQRKNSLKEQLTFTEKKLYEINNKLEEYKLTKGIVDLDEESRLVLNQIEDLKKEYNQDESSIAEKRSAAARIQNQLQLTSDEAINATAFAQGYNSNTYAKYMDALSDAEQTYQTQSLIYTPNNTRMVLLKDKIATLKEQMKKYEEVTVGYKLPSNKRLIFDQVRINLVEELAKNDRESQALEDKQTIRRQQINDLEQQIEHMPVKQKELSQILSDQKSSENIAEKLKANLIDIDIMEQYKSVFVLSPPRIPKNPGFPTRGHLFLATLAIAFFLPGTIIVAREYLKNQNGIDAEKIEQEYGIPVLTTLPYSFKGKPIVLENCYKKSSIYLKSVIKDEKKTLLSIAPLSRERGEHFNCVKNIARYLAQSGSKVLLIDLNSNKSKRKDQPASQSRGLTDIIEELHQTRVHSSDLTVEYDIEEIVKKHFILTTLSEDLYYIGMGNSLADEFEILNSKEFEVITDILKSYFDVVLFYSSPLEKDANTLSILSQLDGLILLVEGTSTKDQLIHLKREVSNTHTSIVGALVEELAY